MPTAPADHGIDVSIVVVSYNTLAMTLDCLRSIVAETRECSYEVIVVDNASADGSAAAIAAAAPWAALIASPENLGFARANNLAARRACGRLILLLNPDTVIRDGAIDRLVAFANQRPAARLWGGRTLFADGQLNPASCWARMTPWNLLCRATGLAGLLPASSLCNGEAYGGWDRAGVREVDIVSGCFLLLERQLWQTLGGFDPTFFMYGEDADLCLRARAFGARPATTSAATILHHGGASEATRVGKMVALLTAKATLIRRHWHPALAPLGLALLALWPAGRAAGLGALGGARAEGVPGPGAGAPDRRSALGPGPVDRSSGTEVWREIWRARVSWLGGY